MNIASNGRSNNLEMITTNARWWQLFKYNNANIVNEKGKVMDVSGNRDVENQNIHMWNKHNGLNQQWDIVYADDMPAEPKKGELNEDFGFYVERPFHIISQMPSRRYLDIVDGRQIVIKTPNGYNT